MEAPDLKINRSVQLQQKAQRTSTTTTLGLVVSLRQTYRVEPRGLSSYLAGKEVPKEVSGRLGLLGEPQKNSSSAPLALAVILDVALHRLCCIHNSLQPGDRSSPCFEEFDVGGPVGGVSRISREREATRSRVESRQRALQQREERGDRRREVTHRDDGEGRREEGGRGEEHPKTRLLARVPRESPGKVA